MNPILRIKNISLSQIDFDDFTFTISPAQETVADELLVQSIARYGILHPPVLREKKQDSFSVVTGRKRLQGLRSLQSGDTAACLVVCRQTPEMDIFLLLLEEIQLSRQLTTVEQAILLQKATAVAGDKQIISEFLPRLGLAPHAYSLKHALQLLVLEDQILLGLHQGRLHETVARNFVQMPSQDRLALYAIITDLQLSFSYQKKLLTMCRELASRSNISIEILLNNDEVRTILYHPDANPPQKTKNLMHWLWNLHQERSSKAAAEFRRFVSALKLPENVAVEPAPFFENDILILSITFRNRQSLQNAWDKIRHAAHSDEN